MRRGWAPPNQPETTKTVEGSSSPCKNGTSPVSTFAKPSSNVSVAMPPARPATAATAHSEKGRNRYDQRRNCQT